MSQSAAYNSAYNGDLTILSKPYAHGDNGTASLYSYKGGSSKRGSYKGGSSKSGSYKGGSSKSGSYKGGSSKGGSYKGGSSKRRLRRLSLRRSITHKNHRRCRRTTCKSHKTRHGKCTHHCIPPKH